MLIDADDVAQDPVTGEVTVGGLFGVKKKGKKSLPMVFDRRPQNAQERRLRWALLPQLSQLRHIVLRRQYQLRGSVEDLRNYFSMLRHDDETWFSRNTIDQPLTGDWLSPFLGGRNPKRQ